MKWKTSTIVLILMVAIGAVSYFYFDANSKISEVNETIEMRIREGIKKEREEIENQHQPIVESLKKENEALKGRIDSLQENISFIKYGGELEKYRNQIKSSAVKSEEKLKIRKGEIYRHKQSGIIVYVKKDFYEEQVLVNLTLPDKESEEHRWEIGKYYYYWNPQRNELNQLMPTFIQEDFVELEWIFYKGKKKESEENAISY